MVILQRLNFLLYRLLQSTANMDVYIQKWFQTLHRRRPLDLDTENVCRIKTMVKIEAYYNNIAKP